VDKTTVTAKGQIVVPARLRQKLNIREGTQVSIFERDGDVVVRPITDEYIQSCMGMAGTKGRLLKALSREKSKERERESRRKGT
jgi:AbrB family looped-hinge helix DNA binding protein